MNTVKRSTVADKAGYQLSPIQPSLRLAEISERARLRAMTVKLVRFDRHRPHPRPGPVG